MFVYGVLRVVYMYMKDTSEKFPFAPLRRIFQAAFGENSVKFGRFYVPETISGIPGMEWLSVLCCKTV